MTKLEIESAAALSAAALGRALAHGQVDARELAEFLLARIAGHPDQAVFIEVTGARARREADAAHKRLAAGTPASPLDGVPVAWKDLVDLAGTRTTAGSSLRWEAAPAEGDAPVAANLAATGMVCLGKTNLTEFAYSGLGLNPHFGTPVNPHDETTPRAPGGSSSGSAVAVAAGLAPCAIGSDTGGSVRVPASFNGIVGCKSSEGRIDKRGVFALSATLDTIGPLARSVEDCVLLDAALRGAVASEVRRVPLVGVRIVVPQAVALDDLEPAVAANFERSLDRLAQAGARIEPQPFAMLGEIAAIGEVHGNLTAAEAYDFHFELMQGPDRQRVDPRVIDRIERGSTMSARDLIVIQRARRRLAAGVAAALDGGVLAMPTTPITAPEIAPLDADRALFHAVNLKALRNTMLGNFLGLCGVALPNGADGRGLPTSLLLSAPGGGDARLLAIGLAAEAALAA